jgi:tetratricopeptide (TPR) repeat protein
MAKPKKQKQVQTKVVINTDFLYEPNKNVKILFYSGIALISFILSFIYIFSANKTNGGFGFPLDDPWIHLTFAKNLVDYHSFSYFKNEMATAGSTSPLYTLLLAAGFLVTSNEMILSYVLGIAFLILSSVFFYKLCSFDFAKENIYALLVTAVFVADKWMNFISVSGMETTMFIFILIATTYFYREKKVVPFAVFVSLVLWARPDGLAFIGAIVADIFIQNYFAKTNPDLKPFSKNDFMKIGIIAAVFLAMYGLMNYSLSGSFLPNTYTAKLAYYAPEFRSRAEFLKGEVWGYFTNGSYGILMVGFFAGTILALMDLFRKKYNNNFLYIIFIFALVFMYWYKLPYAHRFGRYMMPVVPFMIIVSSIGFKEFFKAFGKYFNSRALAVYGTVLVLAVITVFSFLNYFENISNYAMACKYIDDRQVKAAKWIKINTNENDIIATHDVGAIGFYSQRKIVDIAGLVTPELINKISDENYVVEMNEYMKKNGVTYLAFLPEWYRVVNQTPLFSSQDISPSEIMEVYKYDPVKTVILSKVSNSIIMEVQNRLSSRNPQQIQSVVQLLNRSLQLDPNSSLTYFYLGIEGMMTNDTKAGEVNLLKAIEIYPDFKDAVLQLGVFYKRSGKLEDAQKYLEKYLLLNPNDQKVKDQLKEITEALKNGQK